MFRRPNRGWYVRIRRGGKQRWFALGTDFDEACRKFRELKRHDLPPIRLSVQQAAERWLETYVRNARSPAGRELAKARVTKYLVPFMGWKMLQKIGPEDLREYRNWLETKVLKPQTIAHVLSDCRCLFRWAEDAGYILKAPVPARLLPRIDEKPPNRLADEEIAAVSALPAPWGFACRFGLATGLRWGEMTRALVSDIRSGVLIVKRSKTGKIRRVPLPPDILAELRNRVGKVVPWATSSVGSFNRDVAHKSGVTAFHVHRLRHSFACKWLENGGSLPALQKLLGHASITTTQRYGQLSDEAVFEEAKRVQLVAKRVAAALDDEEIPVVNSRRKTK
jgi:integrase